MARGRIINKKISINRAFNADLSSDTSRLAYCLTIANADVAGRVHGDPAVLRSLIFQRRPEVTAEMVEEFIGEWVRAGFVVWYEAEGDRWLEFPKWKENQPNLREDREEPSVIPPASGGTIIEVSAEPLRQDAGVTPAKVRPKRREENTSKDNMAVPPVPPGADTDLYHRLQAAFLSRFPAPADWNYPREGPHLKALVKKAQGRPDPEAFLKLILETFYRLTQGPDRFWSKQPFLPSVLNSGGIWPRILKEIEAGAEAEREAEELFADEEETE